MTASITATNTQKLTFSQPELLDYTNDLYRLLNNNELNELIARVKNGGAKSEFVLLREQPGQLH
jgi:hypothetical protein